MPPETPPSAPPNPRDLEAQRRANRDAVAALGFNPYGSRTPNLLTTAAARAAYNEAADTDHKARSKEPGFQDARPIVSIAGRVMLHRDNGKLLWMQLRDSTGDLQIAVSQRDCDAAGFNLAKATDLGDILIATGPLAKTKTGEITIWATKLTIGVKSLAPAPEKWSGLQDPEIRYRKRYIDLYATPETMRVFRIRSEIISRVRRFFDERDFLEVETPMMQALAGGAAARPFHTHLNALDIDLFMRVSPELYLKRLLVGGFPRVYEVNRNFRNEGIDRSHNPEFTMLEVYEAFGDYNTMMQMTEDLLRGLAHFVAYYDATDEQGGATGRPRMWQTSASAAIPPGATGGSSTSAERPSPSDTLEGATGRSRMRQTSGEPQPPLNLPWSDLTIDFARPFERATYASLFERAMGFPMTDQAKTREFAKNHHIKTEGLDHVLIVGKLFDEFGEKQIDPARPTFVLDYPAPLCPLTRPKVSDPSVAERFELFIGGMEFANAYTELNDPDIQEAKFRDQLKGEDDEASTFRTFDADFVEALKVGMPPAGGLGIGIDRLIMLLTNQRSIRDVILFPFMRPV